ncbi:helix-turn-helix domain-containing protein [Sphingobium sp.]|uniref:TetR/AcrR family transcriptional regulator n=1 Tax=Sphingobium sp. TaxID=1912891 RepID=UPI0028BE2693|nr:helix-turn-helix domain-containing protein [Sphingobium sp.]
MNNGHAAPADPETVGNDAPRARRRRRTREDVVQRIRDAARQLFAERGYGGSTTREIARLADVSETLLFRYYGDKATLFREVVIAPFHQLMAEFVALHPDPTAAFPRQAETRRFTRMVYELFEGNEEMFRALLTGPRPSEGDDPAPGLRDLAPFFDQSVDQVQRRYASAGTEPPFDLNIGVRLGFGMIAASVILRDALFAGDPPDRAALVDVLEQLIAQSLTGPTLD